MSRVLKGGLAVASLSTHREAPPPDPAIVALERRVAQLEAAISDRDGKIEALTAAVDTAFAEGEDAGRKAADDGVALRLERLEDGIQLARNDLVEALSGAEVLAISLARDCLATMFDDPSARTAIVRDLIERQVNRLGTQAILIVEVSSADFPGLDECNRLAQHCGLGEVEIRSLATLGTGDCSLQLRLGRIDVGIGQQWGSLDRLLGAFAEEPVT